MNDWLPVVAGVLILIVAIGIVRLAPHSAWGQELRRSYGVRPSGARGHRTRRDHFRSAGLALVAAVALEATSILIAIKGNGVPDDSGTGRIILTYTFGTFLLAAVAALSMIRSLWKAALWRVELPDTPAHRHGLADAIDHLLDGSVSSEERASFLDVRYLHPQLEQIRAAVVRLAGQHKSGLPENYRVQIKEWTAGIRASAGSPG